MQGLRDLKTPTNPKELERLKGLFAYYAKWVPGFSEKIVGLRNVEFPLSPECLGVIEELKSAIIIVGKSVGGSNVAISSRNGCFK